MQPQICTIYFQIQCSRYCFVPGGTPYKMDRGACQNFLESLKRYLARSCFWRGFKIFSPLKIYCLMNVHSFIDELWISGVNNAKLKISCQISLVTFFWLNILKGTAKAPTVDLLRLNTSRDTKTAFFTPKRYDKQPYTFYMRFSSSPRTIYR